MPTPVATSAALPLQHPGAQTHRRSLLALASLGAVGLVAGLLTGCSSSNQVSTTAAAAVAANVSPALAGNWQFTSGPAVRFAGALTVTGNQLTGLLHPVNMACATATAPFAVHGTVSSDGKLTLSSNASGFAGGALSISGNPAPDQHSLINPVLALTGGTCAAAALPNALHPSGEVVATGQQYQPITGSYTGTFTDTDGAAGAVDATLSQPTGADSNGVYHLTGTAIFANNPCLVSPVITDSTVSGNQISATYTDPDTHASITGTGTFSPDATTLTINNWILTGACDSDAGTGLLTRITQP